MKRVFVLLFFAALSAQADQTFKNYDEAVAKSQWKQAAEIALDIANRNAKDRSLARLKASYALFQAGYPNSALTVLSKIPLGDWKRLPEGENKFVQIVALVQKKVPLAILPGRLEQANPQSTSALLKSEVLFAKGRAALEAGKNEEALKNLSAVPRQSRLFAHAHFLIGTLAVKRKDFSTGEKEFSLVFEPSVLQQSTEFWRDISTQMTESWGGNVRVYLDTNELILENSRLGELAAMALARIAYAKHDYNGALNFYGRIPASSRYYSRATLERVWALLALNRHEEAQSLATQLAVDKNRFESLEAKVLRAIVLTDLGRTAEARQEIDSFRDYSKTVRDGIRLYESTRAEHGLPAFLQTDFREDKRISLITGYQKDVREEMDRLRREDPRLLPSLPRFASALEPFVMQARDLSGKITREWLEKRKADIDRLAIQASLVQIETYLEDREKLRAEFRSLTNVTEAQQTDHDERLEKLLRKVVKETDELTSSSRMKNLRLEMRQSELLWELGSAVTVLSQVKRDKKLDAEAESLKHRAFVVAKGIAEKHPEFSDHARALFFAGYAATELGKEREGLGMLERFVAKYPREAHAPDAFRILADAKFDRNEFASAEALYKKIMEFPESPILGYALYKIGWCAYNRKDFARSLLAFEKTVVWTRDAKDQSQTLNLAREARRDLITLYAEVGDYRRAYDYFSQFLKGDPREWLAELAGELFKNGLYEKSGEVYKLLVSLNPGDPESVYYQASVVAGGVHLRRWSEVIDAVQIFADRFAGEVVQPAADAKGPAARAQTLIREAVLAKEFEYRKAPADTSAEQVTRLYDLYLRTFGNWSESQEPRYRYAVFLKGRKKNLEAEAEFRRHWEQFGATVKEPTREEALRNYVDALKDLNREEDYARLIQLAGEYRTTYPKTKYSRAVSFLIPATHFKMKNVEEAIRESQILFDADPDDEIGKLCFKNLRVAYYDRKNWADTHAWASGLLAKGGPALKGYRSDLKTIQEESLFLQAQAAQNPEEAAKLYGEIATDKGAGKLREKSLVNAFMSLRDSGKNYEALKLIEGAEAGSGNIAVLDTIAGARAALYQEAGDYEHALPLLEKFLRNPAKDTPKDTLEEAKRNVGLLKDAMQAHAVRGAEGKRDDEPKSWRVLLRKKNQVERGLIAAKGDLAALIEAGTKKFQAIVEDFMTLARDKSVPSAYAFEAYCATPLLYKAHAAALLRVAERPEFKTEREALLGELQKIAEPLKDKAKELADDCVKQTEESGEAGKFFTEVAKEWGEAEKAEKVKLGGELAKRLSAGSPWLSLPSISGSEREILKKHLEGGGTAESWYALAYQRWHRKLPGLARLTAADALSKFPDNGELLNLIGTAEKALGREAEASSAFKNASEQGSAHASVNLAIEELKLGRIGSAKKALDGAGKVFEGGSDLGKMVEEFLR